MANIYNDSSQPIRQANTPINGNFQNIIVENLVAENAAIDNLNVDTSLITTGIEVSGIANHSLVVAGLNGVLNGLLPGINNDILISNGTDVLFSNDLIINDLQANTLKIPTTTTGDLLVFDSNSEAQKLNVGASGTFLISDGINPTWNSLPNPLILGGAQINGNLELTSFSNKTLITDNTGFVVSENIFYTSGFTNINTIPSQIYSNVSWYFTQNAWYSIKVQINNNTSTQLFGVVKKNAIQIGTINCNGNNTWYSEFTYNHTDPSGLNALVLTDFVVLVGTTNVNYSIRSERIPNPTII